MDRTVESTARSARWLRWLLFILAPLWGLPVLCGPVAAQELEPRAYSPSPVGANFVVLGGGYSTGGVVFDPSVPIINVHADVTSTSLGYVRTFGLFGRSASAGIVQPTFGAPFREKSPSNPARSIARAWVIPGSASR